MKRWFTFDPKDYFKTFIQLCVLDVIISAALFVAYTKMKTDPSAAAGALESFNRTRTLITGMLSGAAMTVAAYWRMELWEQNKETPELPAESGK
ncbi:MAG: hypothetical protein GX061_03215 [Eubacteriaceae bacterium]|nr:hypothetical protein [Eubacteriaceae bacterium]